MKLVSIVALLLLTSCSPLSVSQNNSSLSIFNGEWVVDSSTGNNESGHVFKQLVGTPMTIQNGRISWVEKWGTNAEGENNWFRISRKIISRPDVSADAVDLILDGQYKAWSRVGIIKVEGDELQLCVNFPQKPHPTEFMHADDGREYVTFRRVKKID